MLCVCCVCVLLGVRVCVSGVCGGVCVVCVVACCVCVRV